MMANIWNELIYDDIAHCRRTRKFTDLYPDETTFTTEFASQALNVSLLSVNQKALYYLLYARYGNSHIASMDENQFKYKMWAIIYQYGPNWQKELQLQETFRNMTEAQLVQGAKTIFNHAHNPGTAPTTSTLEELQYIDDQNTANYKKSNLDAYYLLVGLLRDDVTEKFIRKFEGLFIRFVSPEPALLFEMED